MEVFVVTQTSGDYEELNETPIKVFRSKPEATAFLDVIATKVLPTWLSKDQWETVDSNTWHDKNDGCEIEKGEVQRGGWDCTTYQLYEIEMD